MFFYIAIKDFGTFFARIPTFSINITPSISRKGKCLDNACVESFFGQFKSELFHLRYFCTKREVICAVQKYIRFYNTEQFQAKLNNLTPVEYHRQAA
ncbi:IS3 family transposase [Bacillus sp. OTU530]|uniref:IS3 family transposase n=1 Tax=Bacillus sp. OTU530 TaxID=3043862 RepID=UPI00313DB0C2